MHFKRKVIVFSSSWRFLLNLSSVFNMGGLQYAHDFSVDLYDQCTCMCINFFHRLHDEINQISYILITTTFIKKMQQIEFMPI